MRLATASASPLGSTFFSQNAAHRLPRSRTRPAARRSLNYNPLFRAGVCLRDIERTSPALEAQPSATYIDNESTTLT